MAMFRNCCWILVIGGLLSSCTPDLPADVAEAYNSLPDEIDYNLHVKPILSDKCFVCHGPDKAKQKAGLRLDIRESAYARLPEHPNKVAIDGGDLKGSEVYHRILSDDPDYMMPTSDSHLGLTATEKAIIIKWIDEGAEYKPHWAFVKPVEHDLPDIDHEEGVVNPIDRFVRQKLDQEKLLPAPEASKELLLRRVSLDLTGLPPTVEEIDNFSKDNSTGAYERQVDRLLTSPHYGEKLAIDWLDLARFADSHGYTVDRLRDMSPYRDWVINAFNNNMPFDQFVHHQLAGDLMPNPTKDMLIATAFNRNHQQNMEGGIIEEEFQTEYVIDRTNTLGDAFLGLSVGCARCHDHKYDPIEQKNYYQLFSFFNNVREAGQIAWDDTPPSPTLLLPTEEQEKIIKYIKEKISTKEKERDAIQANVHVPFNKWVTTNERRVISVKNIENKLDGYYDFENGSLSNLANSKQKGVMRILGSEEKPVFADHDNNKALRMNGDVWLDLKPVGMFRKSDPFTISVRLNIPGDLKEGVILHKCDAERLYNYKGYHLYLENDRLELSMSHAAPSNAITKVTQQPVPRNQWIQVTITYDGSSSAAGLNLYFDGKKVETETTMDQLTKDIVLKEPPHPALQIGAWDRGMGFTNGLVDDIVVYGRELTSIEIRQLPSKHSWKDLQTTDLTSATPEELKEFYFKVVDPTSQQIFQELKTVRKTLSDSIDKVEELMVMQEMPAPKKSFVLNRGSYDAPGEEVFPNTPPSILPFPEDLPKNRYGLAQWLTHPDHPLTARVAVNRFWQNFFGTGIVKTSEDFGNQGDLPSHLALLDWLALEFQKTWDVRAINKMIVMSATYRQDSHASHELLQRDPENRLLAHGPVQRLSAEMIRDNALAACGLLDRTIGGKSVKPYQPAGLWAINNTEYKGDSGKAVYRRSLYVLVKRAVPNPTLATFDAPSRSYCVARRQKTNTPLQALVTLNDPTFIEAVRVLGEQMTAAGDDRKALKVVYKKLTGRDPKDNEITLLEELKQTEMRKFKADPRKAAGWMKAGQHRVDKKLDVATVAANAVVASTILNSDASLTKR